MRTMSRKEVNLALSGQSLSRCADSNAGYILKRWVSWGLQHTEVPDKALACFMDGSAKLKAVRCTEQLLLCNTKKNVQNYACYAWKGGVPGSPVVKTLCPQCRGTGSIPGQGTMILHAAKCRQRNKKLCAETLLTGQSYELWNLL